MNRGALLLRSPYGAADKDTYFHPVTVKFDMYDTGLQN